MNEAEARRLFSPARTLGAPSENEIIAQDAALEANGVYSLISHAYNTGQGYGAGTMFLGYAFLSTLQQNGLIRACVETTADDMARNWIKFVKSGEDDPDASEKLKKIEKAFKDLCIQDTFRLAASTAGYQGGAMLYIDTGADPMQRMDVLTIDKASAEFGQGRSLRITLIDPINVFPGPYNSSDPLRPDFYVPEYWYVLGKQVHSSRLIPMVFNRPPMLLLPSYNFLGIPNAQILYDYVLHFQRNRVSASDLLDKFSTTVLKTDMGSILYQKGGTDQLDARMSLAIKHKSNNSIFAIDQQTEDIVKLETPLGGVTDIVRQSLELLAAIDRKPATKLLGLSPAGFNATGENENRNYDDFIDSQCEKLYRTPLEIILKCVQLWLFGEIDPEITFEFVAISEEDSASIATTNNMTIDGILKLITAGAISAEEARTYLKAHPELGFEFINVSDLPPPPDDLFGDTPDGENDPAETEEEYGNELRYLDRVENV